MIEWQEYLERTARQNKSLACFGLDPAIERIPLKEGNAEQKIVNFYTEILDACEAEGCLPGAVKPNYAFFAQYGFEGLRALKQVIDRAKKMKLPVLLDGKRGDIGNSSKAYAQELFGFWQADAVTVAPYMGSDSVKPFIEFAEKHGKGVYVLARTSNAGAKDFQDLTVAGKKLYLAVAEKIVEWGAQGKGNVGAVVGATSLQELGEINALFAKAKQAVPLLIPGVGAQGAKAGEVVAELKKAGKSLAVHRINSSSELNYAYEKQDAHGTQGVQDFAGASVKALKQLNKDIGGFG